MELDKIEWKKVIIASVIAFISIFVLYSLIVAIYAVSLAVNAQGEPDTNAISEFTYSTLGYVIALLLSLSITFIVSYKLAQKVKQELILHGFVVGVVISILYLFLDLLSGVGITIMELLSVILNIVAAVGGTYFYKSKS